MVDSLGQEELELELELGRCDLRVWCPVPCGVAIAADNGAKCPATGWDGLGLWNWNWNCNGDWEWEWEWKWFGLGSRAKSQRKSLAKSANRPTDRPTHRMERPGLEWPGLVWYGLASTWFEHLVTLAVRSGAQWRTSKKEEHNYLKKIRWHHCATLEDEEEKQEKREEWGSSKQWRWRWRWRWRLAVSGGGTAIIRHGWRGRWRIRQQRIERIMREPALGSNDYDDEVGYGMVSIAEPLDLNLGLDLGFSGHALGKLWRLFWRTRWLMLLVHRTWLGHGITQAAFGIIVIVRHHHQRRYERQQRSKKCKKCKKCKKWSAVAPLERRPAPVCVRGDGGEERRGLSLPSGTFVALSHNMQSQSPEVAPAPATTKRSVRDNTVTVTVTEPNKMMMDHVPPLPPPPPPPPPDGILHHFCEKHAANGQTRHHAVDLWSQKFVARIGNSLQ
ncbi:GL15824 [Drosophila persimilis]|uniref:GL15824 n=1 Tax=Drosophila persimilis TaxID=7234 RepID=B4H118_DROPE|nr:GL15824 [Drosophila persimilis]